MDKILPAQSFAKKIQGTADEVWTKLLVGVHGLEKHTESEWRALIAKYSAAPATAK